MNTKCPHAPGAGIALPLRFDALTLRDMFFEVTLKLGSSCESHDGYEATVLVELTQAQEEEAAFAIAEKAFRAHDKSGGAGLMCHLRKIQRYVGEEHLRVPHPDFIDESGARVWLR